MTCKDCKYSTWQRTPTGRIKKFTVGKCSAPMPDLSKVMPYCFSPVRVYRTGIGPLDGEGCPAFKIEIAHVTR